MKDGKRTIQTFSGESFKNAEHVTDESGSCWCNPDIIEDDDAVIVVHKERREHN